MPTPDHSVPTPDHAVPALDHGSDVDAVHQAPSAGKTRNATAPGTAGNATASGTTAASERATASRVAARASRTDSTTDPAAMREQYRSEDFTERDLAADPMEQFARWFRQVAVGGVLHEPNAMVVSTATPDGRPSSRTVLLKQYDDRGFVFFTNYESRKGRELTANPHVSLLFPWHAMARQVIVTGTAARTSREETVAYFRTRPHGSQLGAWASAQSTVVGSREELLTRYEELAARYPEGEKVPVPPHWGGFRVVPEAIEFWQGHENRLHDRLRYVREDDGGDGRDGSDGRDGRDGPGGRDGRDRPAGRLWRVERLCP